MTLLKCKGSECREKLVREYNLDPRAHTKLLNGQEKISCTGYPLKEAYYTFEYTSKTNPAEKNSLFCGSHAAKHFLQLLNIPELPIYNPLTMRGNGPTKNSSEAGNGKAHWGFISCGTLLCY